MDPKLLTELEWIRGSLVVIAAAMAILALVGLTFFGVLVQIPKLLRSRMTFADEAKLLLDQGRLEKLVQLAENRIEQYPGDAEAWWYMGQGAYRTGQYRRSLNALRKVLDYQPAWPGIKELIEVIEDKLAKGAEVPELKIVTPSATPTREEVTRPSK